MKILVVLNNTELKNVRIMVELTQKKVIQRVIDLLEQDREKEVFNIVMEKGQVVDYLPYGRQPPERPAVTLIEDIL